MTDCKEINRVWDIISDIGRKARLLGKTNKKSESEKVWSDCSEIINVSIKESFVFNWNLNCLSFYEGLTNLGVVDEQDDLISYEDWEMHYYVIRPVKIPHKKASILSLLQIGYFRGSMLTMKLPNCNQKDISDYYSQFKIKLWYYWQF